MINVCFKMSGNSPVRKDVLKLWQVVSAYSQTKSFITWLGIPSGPLDLETFVLSILVQISWEKCLELVEMQEDTQAAN